MTSRAGGVCVCGDLSVVSPDCTHLHTHTLAIIEVPNTGDLRHPFIHCVKRSCPAQNGINYCSYNTSAVFFRA